MESVILIISVLVFSAGLLLTLLGILIMGRATGWFRPPEIAPAGDLQILIEKIFELINTFYEDHGLNATFGLILVVLGVFMMVFPLGVFGYLAAKDFAELVKGAATATPAATAAPAVTPTP